jgi:hypothetical protein
VPFVSERQPSVPSCRMPLDAQSRARVWPCFILHEPYPIRQPASLFLAALPQTAGNRVPYQSGKHPITAPLHSRAVPQLPRATPQEAVCAKILEQDARCVARAVRIAVGHSGASVLPCHVLCHIPGLRQEHQRRKRNTHGVTKNSRERRLLQPHALYRSKHPPTLPAYHWPLRETQFRPALTSSEYFACHIGQCRGSIKMITLSVHLEKEAHQLAVNAIMPYTVLPLSSRCMEPPPNNCGSQTFSTVAVLCSSAHDVSALAQSS